MQAKTLLILVVLTAGVVFAGSKLLEREDATIESKTPGVLFEGLVERVNDVAEIAAETNDGSITLRKSGDAWGIVERGGFPAEFAKVQEAVMRLARLKVEEPKSSKAENHAKLGVQDPSAEGASSKRIVLRDASNAVIAAAVVSSDSATTRGVYARRDGEDQVYLCEGRFPLDASPKEWLDREIISLDAKAVQAVDIVHASGEEVHVRRSDEKPTQFDVLDVPEGRTLSFEGAANSVGTALSYLQLEDLAAASDVDFEGNLVAKTKYTCASGMVIDVTTAKVDDKYWAQFAFSYEEPAEPVGPVATESGVDEDGLEGSGEPAPEVTETTEATETPAAPEFDPAEVQKEVEDYNARLAGWAFEIPSYKADIIAREMEKLLKDPNDVPPADRIPDNTPLSMEGLFDGTGPIEDFKEPMPPIEVPKTDDSPLPEIDDPNSVEELLEEPILKDAVQPTDDSAEEPAGEEPDEPGSDD